MRCPNCRCEYPDWLRACPPCGSALEEASLPEPLVGRNVDYTKLVETVLSAGDRLEIELATVAVGMDRTWLFPYRGFGYAWAERLAAAEGDLAVDLRATEVGRHRQSRLLFYFGYGYAWTRRLEGEVAGQAAWLEATRVEMERRTRFPFLGHGLAWTQQMTGRCGEGLALALEATEIARRLSYRFPYQGYGFAWMRRATLVLSPS